MASPTSNGALPHGTPLPFQMDHLPELNETPENRTAKMQELKTLIAGDEATSGFCFEPDLLVQYLRHSKHDVRRAFRHVRNYVALRGEHAHLFASIPDHHFRSTDSVHFVLPLPRRSPDGCTIVLSRTGRWKPGELPYDELVRLSMMSFCQMMRDPMTQINGFKVIHDFKDTTWSHFRYCTPWNLHFLFYATLDCIPARYKEIHFVNESFVMRAVWNVIKRFLSEKIRSRVFFHHKAEELLEYFPRSALPVEFGGDLRVDSMKEWLRNANKEHLANTINGQPNFY